MALNWDSYRSPDDAEFERVASELIAFGKMDVRGRILRHWIPVLLGRTRLLQRYLSTLYKDAKLGDLPDTPTFHFLATSLTSGQLCSFSKRQWAAASANPDGANFAGVKSDYLELARVVAASAAFPPLFPPVRIIATGLESTAERRSRKIHYLTDGGIFDNLGVAEIFGIINNFGFGPEVRDKPIQKGGHSFRPDTEPLRIASVVVSDASASFDDAKPKRYVSIVSRTSRALDIIMTRLARRDDDMLEQQPGIDKNAPITRLGITFVPPSFELKPGERYETQSASIQRGIKYVRTDLDRFDPKLISYLMRHGHDVAAHQMCRDSPFAMCRDPGVGIDKLSLESEVFGASGMEDEEQLERFIESQKSRFRRDNLYGLLSLPYSMIGVVVLVICIVWFWHVYEFTP